MKKKLLFLFFVLFLLITPVFASTNTNTRTEENNYLLNDWVQVTEKSLVNIMATPAVNADEKIYDFANLFDEEEEKDLYDRVLSYSSKTNYDFAIVTIDHNPVTSSFEGYSGCMTQTGNDSLMAKSCVFADNFYDFNDFGTGDHRDGLLLLIDMDTRSVYISTARGDGSATAYKMYDDNRIDVILDDIYGYLSEREYYVGAKKTIEKLEFYYDQGYPKPGEGKVVHKRTMKDNIFMALGGSFVLTLIIILIMISKNKMVKTALTASSNLDASTKDIKLLGDMLISTHTSKTRISSDSSSGGGGSFHSSSGGGSHGGGGHHF